ncbi:hypothetical protein [Micromonospora coxensis]|uniref:hypothetical protein n=1 Tax=Micromonospora coxensis TaxID=356852 RepID=UPI00343AA286
MAVLVLAGVLVLALCAGGGLFGWFGWFVPRQEAQQREAIREDLGVPRGFTAVQSFQGDDVLVATYRLRCPKGVCPRGVAQDLHEWLSDAGAQGIEVTDVAGCVAHGQRPGGPLCEWRWRVRGCRAEATTQGLEEAPVGWDRDMVLLMRLRECD